MQKSNIIRKFIGDKTHYVEKKEKELVVATISDPSYTTNGENIILVKGVDNCDLILNQDTTTHIIIKSLTNTLLKTNSGLIDEYYEEILMKKGACVELIVIGNNWYVLSSDGLKLD
jgi:hypothetical protein